MYLLVALENKHGLPGETVYYTGKVGTPEWISADQRAAFLFGMEATAQAKADSLNAMKSLHKLRFYVDTFIPEARDPTKGLPPFGLTPVKFGKRPNP